LILERHDHVHLFANEFICGRLSGLFIGQVTELPAQILAILIPKILQALSQSMQGRRNMVESYVK
jgi:hypothetical protein